MSRSHILVIKLGALGDFIQALGPLKAIRDHHPDQELTLLTTRPYEDLARASEMVDHIWIDERPRFYQIGKWLALRNRLIAGQFQRVYDLQTSDRSSFYFKLFPSGDKPEWSGIADGCSHPHDNPNRDILHTHDRQREQLNRAGIDNVPVADLKGWKTELPDLSLPDPYCLLVPGGAPHRLGKRWPVARYQELAQHLMSRAIVPIVLGADSEAALAQSIADFEPGAINLVGKTSLLDIATIARKAQLSIGNDTGPMHIIAASGCPSVVLFSSESDPDLCAPRSPQTTIIRRNSLDQLTLNEVLVNCPGINRD